jgi:uncharacterized protein YraI
MRHYRNLPSGPASRWLTRGLALIALALGLGWVGPVGAVPPGQLAGTEATIVADENLNVRAGPGLDQPVVATIPPGSHVTIVSGPVAGDGTWTWCEHTGWGGQGWSVCQALHVPVEDASVSPAAPATQAPARTTAPAATGGQTAANVPSTPPTPTRVPPTPPPMTPVALPAPRNATAAGPTPAAATRGAAGSGAATSPNPGAVNPGGTVNTATGAAMPSGGTVNTGTGAAVPSSGTVNTATGAAIPSNGTVNTGTGAAMPSGAGRVPAATGASAIPPPPPGLVPSPPASAAGSATVVGSGAGPTPIVSNGVPTGVGASAAASR